MEDWSVERLRDGRIRIQHGDAYGIFHANGEPDWTARENAARWDVQWLLPADIPQEVKNETQRIMARERTADARRYLLTALVFAERVKVRG